MYLRIQSSWGTEPGYGLQTIYDKDLDIAPATIMPCTFKCLRKNPELLNYISYNLNSQIKYWNQTQIKSRK